MPNRKQMSTTSPKGTKSGVKRQPRKGRGKQAQRGAFVNTSASNTTRQTNRTVTMTGTDELAHIPDISKLKRGEEIISQLVTPAMLPRLSKAGGMYQKIKYKRLKFHVISGCPTSQTGSYVCAFVKDPTDDYDATGDSAVARLVSNEGAKVQKAWESTSTTYTSGTWFFTSPGTSMRWFSPGKFIVLMDGVASQPGSVTVTCEWTIELCNQTTENQYETVPSLVFKYPITVGDNFYIYVENHDPKGDADVLAWADTDIEGLNKYTTYMYKSPGSHFAWYTDDPVVQGDSRTCILGWNAKSNIWEAKVCRYDGSDFPKKPSAAAAQEDNFLPGEELIPYDLDQEHVESEKNRSIQTMTLLPGSTSRSRPWTLWRKSSNQSRTRSSESQMNLKSSPRNSTTLTSLQETQKSLSMLLEHQVDTTTQLTQLLQQLVKPLDHSPLSTSTLDGHCDPNEFPKIGDPENLSVID